MLDVAERDQLGVHLLGLVVGGNVVAQLVGERSDALLYAANRRLPANCATRRAPAQTSLITINQPIVELGDQMDDVGEALAASTRPA